MDTNRIKELAEIMSRYALTSLKVSEADGCVELERAAARPASGPDTPVSMAVDAPELMLPETVDFNDITEVKSPIVGVFYSSASPESVPFVTIGSKVKKDDVLCIVEAMKLMNEITAEQDGEIVDICVKNGDIVEYGQVLFKMF